MRRGAPLAAALLLSWALPGAAQDRGYTRLVVLSDLHLPGRLLPEKRKAVDTVNAWKDVDGVVALGDVVEDHGTPSEYAFAKDFLSRLKAPLYPIAGNHEYAYDTGADGKTKRASPEVKQAKLKLFQETFSLPAPRYAKKFGPYLCLFVSNDALDSKFLSALSSGTLAWLRAELRADPQAPAIVFFHAPLEGTIQSGNEISDHPSFLAQPKDELRALIRENPQVFLWVSGHTHLGAVNQRFSGPANRYEGQVTDIHNSDMDGRSYLSDKDHGTTTHDTLWTNSLYLYPDKVVVKTFDHALGRWLDDLTREIRPNPAQKPG